MKPIPEIDRQVYELAKNYLPSLRIEGVTPSLIEKYLNLFNLKQRPTSKEELYRHILECPEREHEVWCNRGIDQWY